MKINISIAVILIFIFSNSCKKEKVDSESIKCETLSKTWQTNISIPSSQSATSIYGTYLLELTNEQIIVASHFTPNLILLNKEGSVIWEYNHEVEPGLSTYITNVEELNSGNVLIAGRFDIANFQNGFVAELDLNRDILWQKTFTGFDRSSNHKLLRTSDGNFILSFDEDGSFGGPTFLKKFREDGSMVWEKEFSSQNGTSHVVEIENGNLLLVVEGRSNLNVLYLYEIDSSGNLIKRPSFFNGGAHTPTGLVAISNSEVIVSGFLNNNELLTALSIEGNVLWENITVNPETTRERNYFIDHMKEENEFIYVSFNENQGIDGFTKIGKVNNEGLITDFTLKLENIRPNCIKQSNEGYLISGYNKLQGNNEISIIKIECQN